MTAWIVMGLLMVLVVKFTLYSDNKGLRVISSVAIFGLGAYGFMHGGNVITCAMLVLGGGGLFFFNLSDKEKADR